MNNIEDIEVKQRTIEDIGTDYRSQAHLLARLNLELSKIPTQINKLKKLSKNKTGKDLDNLLIELGDLYYRYWSIPDNISDIKQLMRQLNFEAAEAMNQPKPEETTDAQPIVESIPQVN